MNGFWIVVSWFESFQVENAHCWVYVVASFCQCHICWSLPSVFSKVVLGIHYHHFRSELPSIASLRVSNHHKKSHVCLDLVQILFPHELREGVGSFEVEKVSEEVNNLEELIVPIPFLFFFPIQFALELVKSLGMNLLLTLLGFLKNKDDFVFNVQRSLKIWNFEDKWAEAVFLDNPLVVSPIVEVADNTFPSWVLKNALVLLNRTW